MIILQSGDPKVGKDSDATGSLPHGLFIGPEGAFLSSKHLWGYEVESRIVHTLAEVRTELKKLEGSAKKRSVTVSDLSILAENSRIALEAQAENGWETWKRLEAQINVIFAQLRRVSDVAVVNCHTLDPVELTEVGADGKPKKSKGGLAMPSAKTAKGPLRLCDAILHVARGVPADDGLVRDAFGGARRHRFFYECLPGDNSGFISGSRFLIPPIAPMNLGQILRWAGFSLEYRFPWQEEAVSRGSKALLVGKDRSRVVAFVSDFVQKNSPDANGDLGPILRHTLRDVIDAAEIRLNAPNDVASVLEEFAS